MLYIVWSRWKDNKAPGHIEEESREEFPDAS